MEKFTEELRDFAAIWMASFEGNEEKSTESLSKLNHLLKTNRDVLPFISKPKNQEVMGEMVQMLNSNSSKNPITIINKLSKAAKNLEM